MWCRLIRSSIAGIVLVALLQAFVGAAEPVSDEFVLTDRVSGKAFPRDVPDDATAHGSRLWGLLEVTGNTIVVLVNTGNFKNDGSASRFFNFHTGSLVFLNLKTNRLEVYSITPEARNAGREFDWISVLSDEAIEFSTCKPIYHEDGYLLRNEQHRWFRKDLRSGRVEILNRNEAPDLSLVMKAAGVTARYRHGKEIPLDEAARTIVLSYDADRADEVIRTEHRQSFRQKISEPLESLLPTAILAPGDETAQLIVSESSAGITGLCSISGYDLNDVSVKWKLSQEELERQLEKTGCLAIKPASGLRYPSPRLPVSMIFQDGTAMLASISHGKVEWFAGMDAFPRWDAAMASADGRFVALSWDQFAFVRRVVLLDTVKQAISTPHEIDPKHYYHVSCVSNDGEVILSNNDSIKVLRYTDSKWNSTHHQILELAED